MASVSLGSHYAVLDVDLNATADEIRKAHRKLALKWHPDKVAGAGDEILVKVATQQFQLLQAAYEVLSDPVRRKQYDLQSGFGGARAGATQDDPPWKRTRRASAAAQRCWATGERAELRVPADVSSVSAAVDLLPARGGTVHVDEGFYEGLVVISKPFVKIFAVGRVTILGQVVFRECAAGAHLKGLKIDASCSAGAVDLKGVRGNVTLEECEITNTASAGFVFEGCSGDTTISRCKLRGCKFDGLGLHLLKGESSHTGSVTIVDSCFEDNGYDGLYLGDPRFRVSLVRCRIERNRRHGVLVRGSDLKLDSCTIEHNGKEGVCREEFRPPRSQGIAQKPQRAREVEDPVLPDGWRAFRTAEGLTYYFDVTSGKTQWSHPAEDSSGTAAPVAPVALTSLPHGAAPTACTTTGLSHESSERPHCERQVWRPTARGDG